MHAGALQRGARILHTLPAERMMSRSLLGIALALTILLPASHAQASPGLSTAPPARPQYLALGDSLALGSLKSSTPAHPHVQVTLHRTVRRGGMEMVTGMTSLASRGAVSYTLPAQKKIRRHSVQIGEGGAFLFLFHVGSRSGAGRVRVCVSGHIGKACTAWLTYHVH
ncbi:MAG TPA: hypothetical protein VFB58_18955 [Chloroflexota bacterium]|nr:hypothetical protein [Chloroflexota bacterium]